MNPQKGNFKYIHDEYYRAYAPLLLFCRDRTLGRGSSDEIFIDDAARREKERIARGAREERGRKKLLREARVEEGFDWPSPVPSTKQDRRFPFVNCRQNPLDLIDPFCRGCTISLSLYPFVLKMVAGFHPHCNSPRKYVSSS